VSTTTSSSLTAIALSLPKIEVSEWCRPTMVSQVPLPKVVPLKPYNEEKLSEIIIARLGDDVFDLKALKLILMK
jgi:hypothetical protein